MKVLFLNWRDIKNPQAGGAEVVTHELAKALVERGDQVDFFAASFPGAPARQKIDGINIYRGGNRYNIPWHAYRFYRRSKSYDLVIDECNTNQFFTPFYISRDHRLFLIHQLTRRIWFYQLPFPLSLIGYLFEPLFIWFHRHSLTVTISQSTKNDLIRFGLSPQRIFIIPMGLDTKPLEKLPPLDTKSDFLHLIYVGRLVRYKRVHEAIKAVALLKKIDPRVRLDIVGSAQQGYIDYLHQLVDDLGVSAQVKFWGRIPKEQRNDFMTKAHFILVTSVLEGWGLIVTEANAFGTPACVYDVGGLRDSVKNNETGLVVEDNNARKLAQAIWSTWKNLEKYQRLRQAGWKWSRTLTFDKMKQSFLNIIDRNFNFK